MRAGLCFALALAGCHWAAGGFGRRSGGADDDDGFGGGVVSECRDLRRAAPAPKPAPPAEAHPDFTRLGAYRNYFRVTHVGDAADHFVVFFDCIEASIDVYAVLPDGTVRFESGGFGGLGIRSGAPRDVPADKRALADRVLAQHAADYEGASGAKVEYLGSYREVTVEEIMPVTPAGDPYKRMMWYQRAIVPMSADLKSIVDKPGLEGGETLMCWHDLGVTDCSEPRWMDFSVAPSGAPVLAALLSDGSPEPAAERARFTAALVAAAAGAAPAKLDDLIARQGGGVLPVGLATPLRAGFTVHARPRHAGGDANVELRVTLSAAEIAHGTARGSARADLDGVHLELKIEAAAEQPAPAPGPAKLRVHFRYQLDDGRGNVRTGEVIDDVDLVVDGDAAAVWSLGLDAEQNKHGTEPPVAQKLPGGTSSSELDADFGVAWNVDPWFPH